ncbi:MAG: hypothetical protein K8R46_08795, partial [Pirellulales bacterium]|nr:hypothetical protein [Pirellulales bacterium]
QLTIQGHSTQTSNIFVVEDSSGSDLFAVSETQATSYVPFSMEGTGDVAMANDLYMSNATASYITSKAPLYITAGDEGTNTNLVLEGRGTGKVYVDDDLTVTGTTTIAGVLNVTGTLGFSGDLDMNNNIITNIGNAGTDFDSNGGLTLAGDLIVSGDNIDSSGAPLRINDVANQPVYIGSGTATTATGDNDLFVTGILEVDEVLDVDGTSTFANTLTMASGINLQFANSGTYIDGTDTAMNIDADDNLNLFADTDIDIDTPVIDLSTQTVDITLNNAVDALNFDSNTLSIDASNNRVGIGTTAPNASLHIKATSVTAPSLTFGANAGQIFQNENSEIAIGLLNVAPYSLWIQGRRSTNIARDIVLQPLGGNVGIGTTGPTGKLDIRGDEVRIWDGTASVDHATGEGQLYVESHLEVDGDAYFASIIRTTLEADSDPTGVQIGVRPSGDNEISGLLVDSDTQGHPVSLVNNYGDAGVMLSLLSSGDVGIGDLAPNQKLGLKGTNAQISVEESDTEFVRLGVGATGGDMVLGWDDGDDMHLGVFSSPTDTSVGTKMVIQSGGNVGIGTTTPSSHLHVYSSEVEVKFGNTNNYIEINAQDGWPKILGVGEAGLGDWALGVYDNLSEVDLSLSTTDNSSILFGINNAEKMRLSTDGYLGVGTTTPQGLFAVATSTNNSFLMVNSDTGFVGIGTDSPYVGLDVVDGGMRVVDTSDNSAVLLDDYQKGLEVFNTSTVVDTYASIKLGARGTGNWADGIYLKAIHKDNNDIDFALGEFNQDGVSGTNLYIDTSAGNVGIGTASPGSTLTVNGSLTASAPFTINGDAGDPMFSITGDLNNGDGLIKLGDIDGVMNEVLFTVDDILEKFTFQNGNVGIYDATPAAALTVGNGDLFQVTSAGYVRSIAGAVGTPTYSFTADTDTGMYLSGNGELSLSAGGVQGLTLDSDGSTVTTTIGSGDEAMRIDSAGNIGMGDTTPDVKLKVVGALCVKSDANNCAGSTAG